MTRPIRIIFAAAMLVAVALPATATERGRAPADTSATARSAYDVAARLLERVGALELTTDQRRRVREIQLDMKRTAIPLQASAEVKLNEIEELLLGEEVNEDEVDSKLLDINRVKQEVDRAAIAAYLAVRQVLSAEQLAQLLAPPPAAEPESAQGAIERTLAPRQRHDDEFRHSIRRNAEFVAHIKQNACTHRHALPAATQRNPVDSPNHRDVCGE